jgi:peptide/nickel transport system permease protein
MTKQKLKRRRTYQIVDIPILVILAMVFLVIVLLLAIIGGWIAPYNFQETNVVNSLAPPAYSPDGDWSHLLGTDSLGRDVLSRLLLSIRTTVLIAFTGATISAVVGTLLGMIAGQVGGFTSDAIMMAVDVQASLPFLVFALTALAILGNSFLVLLFVIGISGWESYARLARGMVLSVMERDFVLAARSLGITSIALYRRYLLPNILSALIVQFSISLAGTILLESALSFLGLGIQLPQTSLGQMLGEGRDFLLFAPWLSVVPGSVIFFIILSISLVGDWLRDVLDPTTSDP